MPPISPSRTRWSSRRWMPPGRRPRARCCCAGSTTTARCGSSPTANRGRVGRSPRTRRCRSCSPGTRCNDRSSCWARRRRSRPSVTTPTSHRARAVRSCRRGRAISRSPWHPVLFSRSRWPRCRGGSATTSPCRARRTGADTAWSRRRSRSCRAGRRGCTTVSCSHATGRDGRDAAAAVTRCFARSGELPGRGPLDADGNRAAEDNRAAENACREERPALAGSPPVATARARGTCAEHAAP